MTISSTGCREYRQLNRFTRRGMLQCGVLGGLGLSLPQLLRQEAMAAGVSAAKAKSVILLWLQGGVSHHESFDPKPDVDADIRGEFVPIKTNLPGVMVGEYLPKLSQMMDKLAVIRSVTHVESAHQRGSMYMVAGRRPGPNVSAADINDDPDIGSIVAQEMGMQNGLPAYVSIPGNDFTSRFTGNGWLPPAAAPFKGYNAKSLSVPSGFSTERFESRMALRSSLDRGAQAEVGERPTGLAWDQFSEQAADVISSSKAGEAFDYLQESDETLSLYGIANPRKGERGSGQLPMLCLQARRLVEAGVRFVTIGRNSWDHHSNLFSQVKSRLPRFDHAMSGLITDLEQRGMLDETLVVYLTEFGRTPKVNSQAGRDHWPRVFSVAFAGAGIKTGQVLGASDKIGGEVAERPVTPEEISATILSQVGINPQAEFQKSDGRPMFYVDTAKPIDEILA